MFGKTVIIKTNECPFFIFQARNNHLNLSDCLNFGLVKSLQLMSKSFQQAGKQRHTDLSVV